MTPPLDRATSRWRLAIYVYMLVVGIVMASWIVRTPAVRNALDASTAEMGLVLFGLSVGSMAGVLLSAALVRRVGGRSTMIVGGSFLITGVAVVGVTTGASAAVGVAIGLAFIGAGVGLSEIAINIEGAAIERRITRPVLPVLHGCFSFGTVLGALAGIGMTAIDLPVVIHLGAVFVVGGALVVWALATMPGGTGRVERVAAADARGAGPRASSAAPAAAGPVSAAPAAAGRSADGSVGAVDASAQGSADASATDLAADVVVPRAESGLRAQLAVWRDPRIVMIGVIVLGLALAEGSANDWLPLLMVDGHGASPTVGSVVFTAFAAAMTVGRFVGGPLIARFGNAAVLRVSALVSAAGIALVVFSPDATIAGAAVILWGLGAALGFPVCISAAGDSDDPASSVSAVATAGYLAFLVGPPVLGFLGEHYGLRGAMIVVLVLVAAVSFLSPAARPRTQTPTPEHPSPVPAR